MPASEADQCFYLIAELSSKVGSSIQTRATLGAADVAVPIVHTLSAFNEIVCIRRGELSVVLEECDFGLTHFRMYQVCVFG